MEVYLALPSTALLASQYTLPTIGVISLGRLDVVSCTTLRPHNSEFPITASWSREWVKMTLGAYVWSFGRALSRVQKQERRRMFRLSSEGLGNNGTVVSNDSAGYGVMRMISCLTTCMYVFSTLSANDEASVCPEIRKTTFF